MKSTLISGEKLQHAMVRGAEIGLRENVAEHVLGASVRDAPIAPEPYMQDGALQQPGRLRASGHLEPEMGVDKRGNKISVSIVFDAPYALYQHEGIEFVHLGGGKAKFLEDNIKAIRPLMPKLIAREIKHQLSLLERTR